MRRKFFLLLLPILIFSVLSCVPMLVNLGSSLFEVYPLASALLTASISTCLIINYHR